ncbi:hypothetical protein [Mesorhizobium tianshanense]|uniref:hypothetical protein n=1 Tax=Mesorhizobium tianshanense TaxID=39844 RepID=UPI0011A47624|nr:hypothetical protein [Mesorhizobium tianshanense]
MIDIVEVLLRRETGDTSDGVILHQVSWNEILLDRGDTRVFIADQILGRQSLGALYLDFFPRRQTRIQRQYRRRNT